MQPGLDYDASDAAHTTMALVESLAVLLKLVRVLLSGMLRHGPAIMCRMLVFTTNH